MSAGRIGRSRCLLRRLAEQRVQASANRLVRDAPPDEPPPWLGADGTDRGLPPPPAPAAPRKASRKKITSRYLINYLAELGYAFRLNLCDDSVEVGGERISDVSRAQMRCQLRDAGLGKYLAAADDAVIASAASHPYHPVLDYLKSLTWDQQPRISQLAAHFSDTNGVIGLYLRKWLIGAVARAYTGVRERRPGSGRRAGFGQVAIRPLAVPLAQAVRGRQHQPR